MNKTELIATVAESAGITKKDAERVLNAAFDARLRRRALLAEHARDIKEKQWHMKRQILPGIAAYETLQTVLPKDEAPHHNIGPRRRPLRLLPENSEITAGGVSTWRSNNLAIHRESV